VPTTWSSRDTPREDLHSNSTSMKRPRPSDHNNGRTTLLQSNPMEDQTTLDAYQPSPQDGGNSSDMTDLLSEMKETRSSKSKEKLTVRTRMSKSTLRMVEHTNNGTSSMLMSIQRSQRRVNSMKTSVSMSKEISILSHRWHQTDILI